MKTRRVLVSCTKRVRAKLEAIPGFIGSTQLRAVYVVICTLEGSIMFGGLPELAQLCANFCRDQADAVKLRN